MRPDEGFLAAGKQLPNFINPQSMRIVSPGRDPAVVASETRPSDHHGVALTRMSFSAETRLVGTPNEHLLGVFLCAPAHTRHTMGDRQSEHESGEGVLCVCPSGADYTTEYDAPVEGLVLRVSTECFSLAVAERGAHGARLIDQMDGSDPTVRHIAQLMEAESQRCHPNGTLFWSSLVDSLMRRLAECHASQRVRPLRGRIDMGALHRIDRFIEEGLDATVDLSTLAQVANCGLHHFAHLFKEAVGVSPHRYVVRKRLSRALTLLRTGRMSIAEIAIMTGFADQSHLTRWTRRVYGAPPSLLRG